MRGKKIKSICDFIRIKNTKLHCTYKECKKRWLKSTNGLIKKFPNVYQIFNGNINKFVLLLREGVHPYEYMDSWERFNETLLLPDEKAFYSKLCLEDITDENYTHAQKVFEEFNWKKFGDYHDLYVQSDTLLLVEI